MRPIAILFLAALPALAQPPAFEVASVRPSPQSGNDLNELNEGSELIRTTPTSLTIRGASLRVCIQWAYDVPPFQIEGPAWLKDQGFDIAAKSAQPTDDDHLRLMLRTLLADRLGVKTHTERKEMQVYELTLANGGRKFHESSTDGSPVFSENKGSILAERISMQDFAEKISEAVDRPVMDATDLKGRYDVSMNVNAYMTEGKRLDVMSVLFTAMQQQLGLKLESRKDTPNILIVDNAEKTPTDN